MRLLLACLLLTIAISSCTMNYAAKGEYYLDSEKYGEGVEFFQSQLDKNPDSPTANFYLGQCLLSLNEPARARPYLEKAVRLEPGKAEYFFQLGLAYSALDLPELEESSYRQTVALDKGHGRAYLYLGHVLMEQDKWSEALECYERVLELEQANPQALYNKGLVLRNLEDKSKEATAWKEYLSFYPEGKWAIRAADHLNDLGDFEYRNFTIGHRRFPVKAIRFSPLDNELDAQSSAALEKIGKTLQSNPNFDLEILVYQDRDSRLARTRAESIKEYFAYRFPDIDQSRLKVRAIGKPEIVTVGSHKHRIKESVVFMTKRNWGKKKS